MRKAVRALAGVVGSAAVVVGAYMAGVAAAPHPAESGVDQPPAPARATSTPEEQRARQVRDGQLTDVPGGDDVGERAPGSPAHRTRSRGEPDDGLTRPKAPPTRQVVDGRPRQSRPEPEARPATTAAAEPEPDITEPPEPEVTESSEPEEPEPSEPEPESSEPEDPEPEEPEPEEPEPAPEPEDRSGGGSGGGEQGTAATSAQAQNLAS